MAEGFDYSTDLLLEFYARARCTPMLVERRRAFMQSVSDSSFSSTFFFFFCQSVWYGYLDVFVMGLSWLFGRFCFDAYWRILIRCGLWHACAPKFLSFILFVYAG